MARSRRIFTGSGSTTLLYTVDCCSYDMYSYFMFMFCFSPVIMSLICQATPTKQ